MRWRPKVEYAGTTLVFSRPQRPWTPESVATGGHRTSASGVMEAYEIRRDEILEITLRFTEPEWPAVRAWLAHAQRAGSFDFYSDRNDSTGRTCLLESPAMGEPLRPERAEYGGDYEMSVRIRAVSGGPWAEAYY